MAGMIMLIFLALFGLVSVIVFSMAASYKEEMAKQGKQIDGSPIEPSDKK